MKERQLRNLRPEIRQQLLPLVARLIGKPPAIRWVDALPHETGTMLVGTSAAHTPYEIQLSRGSARFADHLVAHEVGHIVRLHEVPPEERLMPVLTPAACERAIEQVLSELRPTVGQALGSESLGNLCFTWISGVVAQLASAPADLRIEAWLHRRYPGLRAVQQRSLLHEVQRSMPLFDPDVIALTPPCVYRPTMAMNAAQAWHVAALFNRTDVLTRFQEHSLAIPGRNLARIAMDAPDQGHRSDMEAVDRWADELGVRGWFDWRPTYGDPQAALTQN